MAFIICKDCKKEYSSDAKRCPNCGAINRSANKLIYGGIVIACIFYAALFLIRSGDEDYAPPVVQRSQEEINLDLARSACREFVKKSLHDPDSAEFDDSSAYWAELKKGTYEVQVTLRAKNGFNALRHFTMDCKVTRLPNGNWVLVKLKEI